MEICLHGQRRFLVFGFEALKLDFLDDGRDIGEINLLDGGFDMAFTLLGSRLLPGPSAPSAGKPKGARRARSLVSIAFIRK
jgi:hypothetical protein